MLIPGDHMAPLRLALFMARLLQGMERVMQIELHNEATTTPKVRATDCKRPIVLEAAFGNLGSQPPFAARANRKNWIVAVNVRFLQVVQSGLHPQRRTAFRK